MKRRSFFLLEVLIATILIGGFAYISFNSAFRIFHKQKKMLTEIKDSMDRDLQIMDTIQESWNIVETVIKASKKTKHGFYISCKEGQNKKQFLLELRREEGATPFFYYVVSNTDPN
jgi:hypothetical protein